MMQDEDIAKLKQELVKWRGRAVEAAETACMQCRAADPDMCRHCRMDQIKREAGQ